MIVWPITLPPAPYASFEIKVVDALTTDEYGLVSERKRTYPDHEGKFAFRMCPSHLPILKTFYDVTLNQVKPFSAPWLVTAGFPNHCAIMEKPELSFKSTWWEVSIQIRIVALVPRLNGNINYGEV